MMMRHESEERQKRQRRQIAVVQPADDQVRPEMLEERHDQARRIQAVGLQGAQRARHGEGRQKLVAQLGARGQAEVAAVHDLQIVVGKSDGAEGQRRDHGDPDEAVAQVGPQQRRDQHADNDQHAAHGRRAGFLLVGLRAVLADVLADLEFTQAANHRRADDEADEQRGQAGEGGAEGQIAKDSERADMKDDENPSGTATNRANSSPFLDFECR